MKPYLIKIDKNTGECEPHDDIYTIEAFNRLMRTKYTTDGDHDGRKKKYHVMLLRFIKHYADYGSRMSGIPDKERMTKALRDAGLDPKTFKMDAVVQAAMDVYVQYQNEFIPSSRILNSLEKGMMLSSYAVDTYTEQMSYVIDANNKQMTALLKGENVEDKDKILSSLMASNTLLQNNLEAMMAIAKQLPTNLKSIRELQRAVEDEEATARKLSGGKAKGRREDPK